MAEQIINHPGMTVKWFDTAVHRAHCRGCKVMETGEPGVLFVTSGTRNITYRVTRKECNCEGHARAGRCYHRALAIAYVDVFRKPHRRESSRAVAS